MSFVEFKHWLAFDELEPIGMIRENAFQASIAKSVIDAKYPNHDLGLTDFMLWHEEPEKSVDEVRDAIRANMSAYV
ncbi:phage tail assembly protein T [Acinetobacter sp. ANC 4641]|uniref:phage tail assembly protein T n=1 Tax=Acinetobacter sp. ANC 4641 TaxID=2529847 RepID=UPI00103955E0|nr:DUF4035 domain-containing protein [Acinetobacter sp. ANC 4641]TCB09583.1 DUF4035 domain-containing protein [Acinetobacter sp. ANC 4641]